MRALAPAHDETLAFAEANATLTRILGAIEEYVYTGEFLGDAYRLIFAGPCRERFLGLSAAEARTATWGHYVHPDDMAVFESAHDRALSTSHLDVQYRLVGADGVVRWVRDRGRVRREHGRAFLDGSILDVTAIRTAQHELESARAEADRLAHVDPLTGLANRRSLPERLISLGASGGLGVLAVDVDRFKYINDFFGHASGDAVLAELGRRLRASTRSRDELFRMGGEEFLVLLPGVLDDSALLGVAEGVRAAVSDHPFPVAGERIPVTVSIGAARASSAPTDEDEVLTTADDALYAAKNAGRDRVHLAGTVGDDDPHPGDQSHALSLALTLAAVAGADSGPQGRDVVAVSLLAARIARRLGATGPQVLRCRLTGLLADVGNLRLPAELLAQPGPLSAAGWEQIRGHPGAGEQLVAAVPELRSLSLIVRHHHERWDGSGYPDGLRGAAIPLESRIFAVADCWQAMASLRPHRPALTPAEAHAELDRGAGTHLDPVVVDALRSVLTRRRDEAVPA